MSEDWSNVPTIDGTATTANSGPLSNYYANLGNAFKTNEIVLAETVEELAPIRPRVWTVYLMYVMALAASIVVSTITMFAAVLADGRTLTPNPLEMQSKLQTLLQTRTGFLLMVLPGQAMFLGLALLGAWLSRHGIRERLGLNRGQMPGWTWPILAFATPAVGIVSGMLLQRVFGHQGENMEQLNSILRSHSGPFLAVIVFAVGILPGICEEFFFRGYIQTRLLARYPAILAITISALFFSLAHWEPLHILGVLPLGMWLGVVAWKAGSIWPAVLGHAVNNSFGVVMTMVPQPAEGTVLPSPVLMAVGMAVLLMGISFLGAAVLLTVTTAPKCR